MSGVVLFLEEIYVLLATIEAIILQMEIFTEEERLMFIFNLQTWTIQCGHCGHHVKGEEKVYYLPGGRRFRLGCSQCGYLADGDCFEEPMKITLFPQNMHALLHIERWVWEQ